MKGKDLSKDLKAVLASAIAAGALTVAPLAVASEDATPETYKLAFSGKKADSAESTDSAGKGDEAKCGEGKCGEGKCGEGKCGSGEETEDSEG